METTVKYIMFRGNLITLNKNSDGFWTDAHGTLFSYTEDEHSLDDEVRAGIGWFSLSPKHPLSEASRGHDHAYSSPIYQAFHTREEADHYLEQCLKLVPGEEDKITPDLFHWLSRQFGFHFWENKKTNK